MASNTLAGKLLLYMLDRMIFVSVALRFLAKKKKAEKYIIGARNMISSITKDKKHQKLLHQFTNFVIARQK